MKVNLLVNCQYYENYNVGPDGFNTYGDKQPHWKPKGGHTFSLPIDSDTIMYTDKNDLVEAISVLVEKQSNVASRFVYIDHEIQWSEPEVIEGLENELKKFVHV